MVLGKNEYLTLLVGVNTRSQYSKCVGVRMSGVHKSAATVLLSDSHRRHTRDGLPRTSGLDLQRDLTVEQRLSPSSPSRPATSITQRRWQQLALQCLAVKVPPMSCVSSCR